MNLDLTSHHTKINSKYFTGLYIKCYLLNPSGEKGENLWDLGLGKDFLDWQQKCKSIVGKTDTLDLTGMESFCPVKDHSGRMSGWDQERLFSVKCLGKDWRYQEYIKKLKAQQSANKQFNYKINKRHDLQHESLGKLRIKPQ